MALRAATRKNAGLSLLAALCTYVFYIGGIWARSRSFGAARPLGTYSELFSSLSPSLTPTSSEFVTKDVEDTPSDVKSVVDRNATTLFLTELFRGKETSCGGVMGPLFHQNVRRSRNDAQLFLSGTGHIELSVRKGASQSPISRRTRTTPLSVGRRAMHCL